MENKCEKLGIQHAWRESSDMYGFSLVFSETCANCNLKKTRCTQTESWWSYSDGRPNESIIDIRPV